tara:strand:+ start:1204 stop:1656 length:453 start_codon:yes stop_codon:yes gene_type:complete
MSYNYNIRVAKMQVELAARGFSVISLQNAIGGVGFQMVITRTNKTKMLTDAEIILVDEIIDQFGFDCDDTCESASHPGHTYMMCPRNNRFENIEIMSTFDEACEITGRSPRDMSKARIVSMKEHRPYNFGDYKVDFTSGRNFSDCSIWKP